MDPDVKVIHLVPARRVSLANEDVLREEWDLRVTHSNPDGSFYRLCGPGTPYMSIDARPGVLFVVPDAETAGKVHVYKIIDKYLVEYREE